MSHPITRLNAALEGRYRIKRELGEGGMATVYLADDLRHKRKVALKVLKPELAAVVGAERFLAEIETTANLQHPHILPLFDSGEADGLLYYVMPYVEGESLRQRLDREHQLPVDDAVRIATNVAEALDYAHRQGVIHRDIKPANVLFQDGKPVISDFGIALAARNVTSGTRLTETGLSLGTPGYMSPEQAAGDQAVGPRSDVYSLGCVSYEMLVGEPPFTGRTAQALLGKIMAGPPPSIRAQRDTVPQEIEAAVLKAVARAPVDRHQSARDFIDSLLSDTPPRSSVPRSLWRRAAIASIAAAIGVSMLATAVLTRRNLEPSRSPGSAPFLLSVEDLTQLTLSGDVAPVGLYPSPSGDLVLITVGGHYTLVTNDRLRTLQPLWHDRVLAGLESVHWYPEGTSILAYGFHGDRDSGGVVEGTFQVSVLNGDVRPTATVGLIGRGGGQPWQGVGGAVLDGDCLYMPWPRRNRLLSLICVPSNEMGTVDTVATVRVRGLSDTRPLRFALSPSQEWAFAVDLGTDSVFSVRLADGSVVDRRRLPQTTTSLKWTEDGEALWLLVSSGGTEPEGLYRLSFDPDGGRFGREAMPHTLLPNLGVTDFALAREDSLLFLVRTVARSTRLWTGVVASGQAGSATRLASGAALDSDIGPAIGPSGERVAYWIQDRLLVTNLESGSRDVLGEFPHSRIAAMRWSSDGRRIAFLTPSDSLSPNSLSVIDATTGARQLLGLSAKGIALDWLPDGRTLVIVQNVGGRMGADRLTLVDVARETEETVVDDLGFYRIDRLNDRSGTPSVDVLVAPSGRKVIALSGPPWVMVDLDDPEGATETYVGRRPFAWLDSERLLVTDWSDRVGVEGGDGQVEWLFAAPEYCRGIEYHYLRQVWACSGEEREANLFRVQLLQPSATSPANR